MVGLPALQNGMRRFYVRLKRAPGLPAALVIAGVKLIVV